MNLLFKLFSFFESVVLILNFSMLEFISIIIYFKLLVMHTLLVLVFFFLFDSYFIIVLGTSRITCFYICEYLFMVLHSTKTIKYACYAHSLDRKHITTKEIL